jgi:hypothetical protein
MIHLTCFGLSFYLIIPIEEGYHASLLESALSFPQVEQEHE